MRRPCTGSSSAARFLAFRRGVTRAASRDAIAAMALTCDASFAGELGRESASAAVAFERQRRRVTNGITCAESDTVWLLAMLRVRTVHPSCLATVIPELRRRPGPQHTASADRVH